MTDRQKELLQHIFIEYAPLIKLHAQKLKNEGRIPQGIDENDLHIEGLKGLADALSKYRAKRGSATPEERPFATYAQHRIRGKMLDHIAANDVVPKTLRNEAKAFNRQKQVQAVAPVPAAAAPALPPALPVKKP